MFKKDKILIFTYTKKQVAKINPLIKKLKKDDKNEIVVLGVDVSAQKELQKINISYKTSGDYVTEESHERAIDAAMLIAKKWHNFESQEELQELATYKGISLGNLVEFDFFLFIFEVLKNVETARCIIDIEKPDRIVIVDDNDPTRKVGATVGRAYNIPTWIIRPGIFDLDYYFLKYFKQNLIKHVKPHVVKYFNRWTGFNQSHWVKTKNAFDKTEQKGMNNILALTYWRPDINEIIIPVIKELKNNSKNRVMVLGLSENAKKQLEEEDIPYKTFGDYSTNEIERKVKTERISLAKKWQELKRNKNFRESLSYSDIPLWELLEEKFSTLYLSIFVQTVKYAETSKHLINKENINAIVLASDHRAPEKTTVTVGNIMKIPTLVIQHGVLSTPQLILPITASKMAVMGETPKNQFVDLGESPERLIVTGSPKYDFLSNRTFDKQKIYRQLSLNDDKNTVVLTTQNAPREENEALLRAVLKAVGNLSDIQLVIKPHPVEDEELHKSLVKEIGTTNAIVNKNVDLYELLNACDVLMTTSSTTALEAMILNKPIVIINLTGEPEPVPYVRSGAAIGAYKPTDITKAVEKILHDSNFRKELEEKREKFVYGYAYKMDGKASKRVVDLIDKMIGEST